MDRPRVWTVKELGPLVAEEVVRPVWLTLLCPECGEESFAKWTSSNMAGSETEHRCKNDHPTLVKNQSYPKVVYRSASDG
jgi:hypothetical protein